MDIALKYPQSYRPTSCPSLFSFLRATASNHVTLLAIIQESGTALPTSISPNDK